MKEESERKTTPSRCARHPSEGGEFEVKMDKKNLPEKGGLKRSAREIRETSGSAFFEHEESHGTGNQQYPG